MLNKDYSAMTNAELWDYYQANENFLADFWAEISSRGGLAELEVFALRQKLAAARAEAQRLREQRDELAAHLTGIIATWLAAMPLDPKYNPVEARRITILKAYVDEWRALLDRIAAEDASAQGGE